MEAYGHDHRHLLGDDALSGHSDGLESGRTEAVYGNARRGDGKTSAQSDLAGYVSAGRAFPQCASHHYIFYFAWINASTGDGVPHHVTAQSGTVSHVQGSTPRFGKCSARR